MCLRTRLLMHARKQAGSSQRAKPYAAPAELLCTARFTAPAGACWAQGRSSTDEHPSGARKRKPDAEPPRLAQAKKVRVTQGESEGLVGPEVGPVRCGRGPSGRECRRWCDMQGGGKGVKVWSGPLLRVTLPAWRSPP